MLTAPAARYLVDAAIVLTLVLGIRLFRSPRTARLGNLSAAGALTGALLAVLWGSGLHSPVVMFSAMLVGGSIGCLAALRTTMIGMPAMIAFQHGAGGIAAFLISYGELAGAAESLAAFSRASGFLGLTIGAATFSASMVASGKLAGRIRQTPVLLTGHNGMLLLLPGLIIVIAALAWNFPGTDLSYLLLIVLAGIAGVLFAIRIGGADMPVLISFLNATAGFAAAFCGSAIRSSLLVACGAAVAASGSVLTIVMCRGMNRGLGSIFLGTKSHGTESAAADPEPAEPDRKEDSLEKAVLAMREAASVIVVPGYGMALAQAQILVAELTGRLESLGKQVRFAIHPVAGRMPGHMNVLLAEVDISYDKLIEMEAINSEFKDTDLVLIIGASDVVNPAAAETEGTPISGMPILMAHEARSIVVCNLDDRPGYSGVPNTLYRNGKAILIFGDAKQSLQGLLQGIGV